MNTKKIWLGVALTAVAGGGYLYMHDSGAKAPTRSVASSVPRDEAPPQKVVVEHVLSIPSPQVAPPQPSELPSPAQEANAGTPEDLALELQTAFDMAPPPDRQARTNSATIASAFRTAAAQGASLDSIECRASRCRLQLSFDNDESDHRTMTGFFSLLSSNGVDTQGMRFIVPTRDAAPGGKVRATVHLFRGDDPA